jgi:hypothetical protein
MLGLDAGTEFPRAFTVEGVYDYFCQPHYSFGMVGRLIVGRPHDGPAVTRPLSELNEASREEMPAVETILDPEGRTYEWAARINGILLMRAHGEPIADAADAVRQRATGDEALMGVLESAGMVDPFRTRLDSFLDGAVGDVGYETLVARADEAKGLFDAARGA